jgi:hypothetical protein
MDDFRQTNDRRYRNVRVAVTWPVVVAAVYVVIVGIGIPIATNFFPQSFVGRNLRNEWGAVVWWSAILIPPLIFALIADRVRRRSRR